MEKKRIIKDYDKLPEEIHEQIKLHYPSGFSQYLIKFTNKEGLRVSALPFETPETSYLLRMTVYEAQAIIENDDDYDDDGLLKDDSREEYEDKYYEEDESFSDY
jgi:hypothetical protein